MKTFSQSQSVNMRVRQSAIKTALAVHCQSIARSASKAIVFALAAGCLVIVLAALQISFIGGMDVLGIAPQVSFLCLNVALLALFYFLLRPALPSSIRGAWRRNSVSSEAAAVNSRIFRMNASLHAQPMCKVLIIRRSAKDDRRKVKNAQAEQHGTWRTFDEKGERDEVTFNA